jgi:phosphoadenosine phosphosulfate reductase
MIRTAHPPVSDAELLALDAALETASASEIVGWATETFGADLCLAASMADAVLIDVATRVDPSIEVVFLDTQYHFPETLRTAERVRARYALRLVVLHPDAEPDERWRHDPDGCCRARKVEPLDRHLAGRSAWMSGVRRADSAERAGTPIVERDRRGVVKVNPLATWTDDDVAAYVAEHDVTLNPLLFAGYPSIGCWPCTQPVQPGDAGRSGRWAGSAKTECGLHLGGDR